MKTKLEDQVPEVHDPEAILLPLIGGNNPEWRCKVELPCQLFSTDSYVENESSHKR